MTLPEFSQVFAVLAVQLRFTDADEATIRGYFRVLGKFDLELVQMAAERFAAVGTQNADSPHWFPKTSEWRAAVAKVEADQYEALWARLRKLPEPLCRSCRDTGWDYSDDDRVHRCDCQKQRRLEVLGRRPFPALPEASEMPEPDPAVFEAIREAVTHVKGMP